MSPTHRTSWPTALLLLLFPLALTLPLAADDPPDYQFTTETEAPRTPVRNQARTGTCWAFATVSFLESELLRLGRGEFDLSEMYIVRQTYPRKADRYIRHHGRANFGQGGQAHDVLDTMRRHGIAPESAYSGLNLGWPDHDHREMVRVLETMLGAVLKRGDGPLTPRWAEAFAALLDVYLGRPPDRFEHDGREYTPHTFLAEHLKLDLDAYVTLTSYRHHPDNQFVSLELPDNWTADAGFFNLPLDDFERAVDHALRAGHTVVWDGDVSEKDFSSRKTGYGIVPLESASDPSAQPGGGPRREQDITPELRQVTFDNHTTTDDHLMHIVGLAKDQAGTKFYLTKNSSGTRDRAFEGYVYLSRAYFLLKTTAVMLHRDALPEDIRMRLAR